MSENMDTEEFQNPFTTEVPEPSVSPPPPVAEVVPRPTPSVSSTNPFTDPSRAFTPNTGLSANEIRNNPQSMEQIRAYMRARKGSHVDNWSDEELYDKFINHMRSFNVNEVTTGGELLWARRASDEERQLANQAYGLFDSLGSVLTNDGISGAFDGIKDYVWSTVTAPSTWAGAVIGRVATAPARAVAVNQVRNVVTAATAARAAAPVGDIATRVALEVAQQEGRNIAIQAARQSAVREVVIGVATDAALSSTQDVAYQLTRMTVGAQDDYSFGQTLLNSATGLVGGIPSGISYIARQRDAADISTRAAIIAQRNSEEALERARPEIEKALEAFDGEMINWLDAVNNGRMLNPNDLDLANKAVRILLDPDPANRASIVGAMQRAGVGIKRGDPEAGAVEQIASFARNISPEKKAELDDIFRKHLNGLTFDQFTDVMVATVSQAGTNLKLAKDAADALTKAMAANKLANDNIVGFAGDALRRATENAVQRPPKKIIQYVQSLWRRALVSHPATTAVNVAGWAQVEGFKAVAEIIHGGVLGAVGLAAKLSSPVSAKAGKWADKALLDSKALLSSQVFKLRTLLSPTSTKEVFDAMMSESSPKMRKKLQDSLYGGIDGTSEAYNISKDNKAVKAAEAYLDRAGKLSLLKVQDVFTKSMSFVTELDKQLRLINNTTLTEVLAKGDLSTIPDEVFEKATNATLKSTMSYDYSRSDMWFRGLAKVVETFSNMPIIGFLFPFGRFMNNQLAFMLEYTPLAGIQIANDMIRKRVIVDSDIAEAAAKAAVGTMLFAQLIDWDAKGQAEGRAWYEVEDATGSIVNVQNMAPISAYMVGARVWNAIRNKQMTPELWDELEAQLGPLSMMNTLQQDPLGGVVRYINSIKNDEQSINLFGDFLGAVGTFAGNVFAGFTRPLEPLDAAYGYVMNSDYAVDRRQLSGAEAAIRGATRYVENIFAPLVGDVENVDGANRFVISPQRQDATQFGPVRDPNPISRMLGRREQPENTEIHQLLNMVNIPGWTIQERSGIPEWDALMNEVITPRLNQNARQLMNSRAFKNGSQATRERLVRLMLRNTRDETINMVQSQLGVQPNLLRMRQAFIRKPASLRRQAMEDLNITTNERELSYMELQQLSAYIDIIERQERRIVER